MPSIRATIPPVQTPTARLLELLELLQTRPLTTGREISDHLAIDARTVRRYVAALQDLGLSPHNVVGISLPLLRLMFDELGFAWTDFWTRS